MDYLSIINEHERFLNGILNDIGWDREKLKSALDMMKCPINNHHLVPSASFSKHVEICKLVSMNFSREEASEILASRDKSTNSDDHRFSAEELAEIIGRNVDTVPFTIEQWRCMFNTQERSKVYTYLAKTLNFPRIPEDDDKIINLHEYENKNEKPNIKEMLAATRDQKRRRKSYRAPPKFAAYKESIRDLIQTQTALLERVYDRRNRSRRKCSLSGGNVSHKRSSEESKVNSENVNKRKEAKHKKREEAGHYFYKRESKTHLTPKRSKTISCKNSRHNKTDVENNSCVSYLSENEKNTSQASEKSITNFLYFDNE